MRILHICVSCFYIDDYSYQENIIPIINKASGNEVKIIASTETYIDGRKLGYIKPSSYQTNEGISIVRIPYSQLLPQKIMKKIRVFPTLLDEVISFKPDVILFHGTAAYDILKIAHYVKQHETVKLYVDCHEAFYNSAKNWISRYILHGMIYKYAFKKTLSQIEKVFYVGYGEKKYLDTIYKLPEDKMEYYPLGGIVIPKDDKERISRGFRKRMGFNEEELLFVHTGKLGKDNNTIELVNQFSSSAIEARLLIAGVIKDEIASEVLPVIEKDNRIQFLGWKNSEEMTELLCSADFYLQPGSCSATLQQAICSGAPILAMEKYYPNFKKDNGFYITSVDEVGEAFITIMKDPKILSIMSDKSYKMAYDLLDYNKLAARIYR